MNCENTPSGSSISMWNLLRKLGFFDDKSVYSDGGPGLSASFEEFVLSASQVLGRNAVPVIMFNGVYSTPRKLCEVEMKLHREVESVEQGKALVSWCLDDAAGGKFEFTETPDWVVEGRKYRHLVPWIQDISENSSQTYCRVDRDWTRIALKKLKGLLTKTKNNDSVKFEFDGAVLKIICAGQLIAVPADGNSWEYSYHVSAGMIR